jgi:uncharacterized phage protein (TIGR01671 family)
MEESMRPIKFRAWWGGLMNYKVCIDGNGTAVVYEYGQPIIKYSGSVVMQATGLNDVNGIEIYEGDVVFGIMDSGIKPKRAIVRFGEYESSDVEDQTETHVGFYLDTWSRVSIGDRKLMVLGNIYENPELMEKKE